MKKRGEGERERREKLMKRLGLHLDYIDVYLQLYTGLYL